MKLLVAIIAVMIVGFAGYTVWAPTDNMVDTDQSKASDSDVTKDTNDIDESDTADRTVVTPGTYTVAAADSSVNWAGQKPLIDGYINSGSIAVSSGSIVVTEGAATGEFVIDMTTLSVSDTPTKPGSESTLESHLKSDRWFDVATYPTATFKITGVEPRADSDHTFIYDVTGDLTMKGVTDSLTFPATIYQSSDGKVYAKADLEFDRTIWGITSGSGSFFDNLADNVIDDMVALSFELVAN